MAYKTITTIISDQKFDRTTLSAAIDIARQQDAHLDIMCLGIDRTQPGFYYSGSSPIATKINMEDADNDARLVEEFIIKQMQSSDIHWSTRTLAAQSTGLSQFLAHQIRFSDLIVLAKPYGEGRGYESEAIVESALFDADLPVWIIEDGTPKAHSMKRIVVAWNEGREALRAIRLALPFLIAADNVDIVIVDPPQHGPDRSDPGGALSQMLARHGAHAEVSVLAKTMPRVSDVLRRHMLDKGADVLVMGAYGHSRFRESILGGATRNMLQSAEFPVFLAH
jgi:nucleotide-binding universal stress UspA family protein